MFLQHNIATYLCLQIIYICKNAPTGGKFHIFLVFLLFTLIEFYWLLLGQSGLYKATQETPEQEITAPRFSKYNILVEIWLDHLPRTCLLIPPFKLDSIFLLNASIFKQFFCIVFLLKIPFIPSSYIFFSIIMCCTKFEIQIFMIPILFLQLRNVHFICRHIKCTE